MSNPQFNPVVADRGHYPKLLYRCDTQFADEEGLKAGLSIGGAVRNCTVADEDAEAAAINDGWTDQPMDFIGTAETPAPASSRRKKAAAE